MTTTPANERNDSERMSKLEGAYEQVNERLGEMNGRIDAVNGRIDGTNSYRPVTHGHGCPYR